LIHEEVMNREDCRKPFLKGDFEGGVKMKRPVIALLGILCLASAATADLNPDVGLAVHVQAPGCDCTNHPIMGCSQFVVSWSGLYEPIDVYVFVSYFPTGMKGTEFGLTWPSDWNFVSWTSCAATEVGTIRNPGDSVIQSWPTCQPSGRPYAVGILQVIPTSAGVVKLIPHSQTGRAGVVDCQMGFDAVLPCGIGNGRAGWASIAPAGCNPAACAGNRCYPCNSSVVCEPSAGMPHPSTYWYKVTPLQMGGLCDFHVKVLDSDAANYTNPVMPPNWVFAVHPVGSEWWASFRDPSTSCQNAIFNEFQFRFTNPTRSTWGDWTDTQSGSMDPYAGIHDASWNHDIDPDGYGYRVHVPTGVADEDEDSD
jgi:hypothetical protein